MCLSQAPIIFFLYDASVKPDDPSQFVYYNIGNLVAKAELQLTLDTTTNM
jgi:hypothetical protein